MARILAIIGNYYPEPSSVAVVADPLLHALRAAGHDVDVLTDRKHPSVPASETLPDGIRVFRTPDHRLRAYRDANAAVAASTGRRRQLQTVLGYARKAVTEARYGVLTKERSTGGWDQRAAVRQALALDSERPYDAIISYSQPYLPHYIAEQIRARLGRDVAWFMHYYDPFSENRAGIKTRAKRWLIGRDEHRMLSACTTAFMTPELLEYLDTTAFSRHRSKFVPIEYASMVDATGGSSDATGPATCFFAGTFYRDIRTPDYLLDVVARAGEDVALQLMTDYFSAEERAALPGNVEVLDMRSREQMWPFLLAADVVVNVGNTVSYQIPAKIFEFFGTGKPLLHIAKIADDPCLTYLAHYPAALVLREYEPDAGRDAERLRGFVAEHAGRSLTWPQVQAAMGRWESSAVCARYVDAVESALESQPGLSPATPAP